MAFIAVIFWLVLWIVAVPAFCLWKVFVKAGQSGPASMIPIYNALVLLKIAQKPSWWLILFFIPVIGFVMGIIVCLDIAKLFGKGAGFGIGLAFLGIIFFPILGFGSATYGPAAKMPPVTA